MDFDKTMSFNFEKEKNTHVRQVLKEVYETLFFINSLIFIITWFPNFLEYFSFISSILVILNIHTADFVYLSITFFPSVYKYSSEYSPVNKSFLTIASNVF